MKRLMVIVVFFSLLAGCQSQPPYVDNGNSGQIKVVVFYDDNRNGALDSGEMSGQFEVGISQDISCPPSSLKKNTFSTTNETGVVLFNDLKPGKYCVGLKGNYSMTTKATQDIYVSSDMITTVAVGVVRDQ